MKEEQDLNEVEEKHQDQKGRSKTEKKLLTKQHSNNRSQKAFQLL